MLKSIVENIVNRTLLTEITCKDAYQRFYKDIPLETYQNIVVSTQGNNNILLPSTKWVLSCFKRNPENTMRDIHTLRSERGRGVLDVFDRLVSRQMISGNDADLNRFKSIAELIDFVYEYDENEIFRRTPGEWSKAIKNAKNDIKKFYEDDKWFVVIPLSMDAACYWGSDTEWCTATRNEEDNYFNSYNEQGPLIILINKENGEKYQFHFESDSFMNKKDMKLQRPILKRIGATQGLAEAINEYCDEIGYDYIDLYYEVVGGEYRGLTPVKIDDNHYNLINEYNEIAFPQYQFSAPVKFNYEWAPVQGYENESKLWFMNFMNADGEMFFEQGRVIREMSQPTYSFVWVKTRKGVNYFDLAEGKFLSDKWYVNGTDFKFTNSRTQCVAFVKNHEGKQNMIKGIDGELYSDEWYDGIKQLNCQNASIFLVENTDENGNSIYNFIEFHKGIISDKWFYSVVDSGFNGTFFCRETPFNEEPKISIIDVSYNTIIENDITDVKHASKFFYGLGGMPTWFIKKNDKFNFLTITGDYRLPQWADEVKFVKPILTPEPNIGMEFLEIKYREYITPLLRYGNEWYYPSCTDFKEPVKLIKYDKKQTNENKLSKKDLMYIINESVRLLTEITIKDAYTSYYKDIPEDVFIKIVGSSQTEPNILLPITKWVLEKYKKYPQDVMNHLNDLRKNDKQGILDLFERLCVRDMINSQQKNINKYKTVQELSDFIDKFDVNEIMQMTPGEWSKAVNGAKNDIYKFYEDEKWYCVIPKNKYAACYWGSGTEWCTATRNENNYFDTYHEDGDMIILIDKQTKEKYQFHFQSQQYMDKKDDSIENPVLDRIGATDGLINALKNYCDSEDMDDEFFNIRYEIVNGDAEDGFCVKNADGTFTYLDVYEDEMYTGYTFLSSYPREWNYLPAKFIYNGNTYVNILDAEGETLFEYDDISEIMDVDVKRCIVKSEKYNGYNIVNLDTGEILFDKWLSNVEKDFRLTIVTYKNNKQNIVNQYAELAFDKPMEMIVPNPYTNALLVCQKIDGKNKWNVYFYSTIRLSEWYDNIEFKINPANQDVEGYYRFNVFACKNEGGPAKLLYLTHDSVKELISDADEIGDLVYCAYNIHGVIVRKEGKYNFFQFVWKGWEGLCGAYLNTWVDKLEIADTPKYIFSVEGYKHQLQALLNGQWHNVGFSRFDEKLKMLPIVNQDEKL